MKDIERVCEANGVFIRNITFPQYKEIVYYLFTSGSVNLGRVIVFYHFTKIIMKNLIKNYRG